MAKEKILIDYDEFHKHSCMLYEKLRIELRGASVVFIAMARGGWLATRILAAAFEENGNDSYAFSVSPTYKRHRTPDEYVDFDQELDSGSIARITELLHQGAKIVIVDSVCQTGREMLEVKNYLARIFEGADVRTCSTIAVEYLRSPESPWRSVAMTPDFFGILIKKDEMPYIDFPWEHSNYMYER